LPDGRFRAGTLAYKREQWAETKKDDGVTAGYDQGEDTKRRKWGEKWMMTGKKTRHVTGGMEETKPQRKEITLREEDAGELNEYVLFPGCSSPSPRG